MKGRKESLLHSRKQACEAVDFNSRNKNRNPRETTTTCSDRFDRRDPSFVILHSHTISKRFDKLAVAVSNVVLNAKRPTPTLTLEPIESHGTNKSTREQSELIKVSAAPM